ncbi:MAG: Rrf2 family transcriptional regulator [Balneolaceae bacterium]
MLLSKSCVYGLRASLYLASKKSDEFNSIREMSEELDISFHFLTKILQQLTADGLMESYTGPKGGIRLSNKGKKATLLDVVLAIDGPGLFTQCALGLPGCGIEKPCPLHDSWAVARESIKEMLQHTNMKDLAAEGKDKSLRITAAGSFLWQ